MAQKWASRIAEAIFWGIDLEGFRRSSGSERFSPPPQDKWMTRDNLMQPAIFVGGEIVFFFFFMVFPLNQDVETRVHGHSLPC